MSMEHASNPKGTVSIFATLTLDDDHLTKHTITKQDILTHDHHDLTVDDIGQSINIVSHKQINKFVKRLNINAKRLLGLNPIRFLISSEYGEKFGRPHYHALFFGVDSVIFPKLLNQSWKQGFTQADVYDLKKGGFRYLIKYVIKDSITKDAEIPNALIAPEFMHYSSRPSLGTGYMKLLAPILLKNHKFPFSAFTMYQRYHAHAIKKTYNIETDNYDGAIRLPSDGSAFTTVTEQQNLYADKNSKAPLTVLVKSHMHELARLVNPRLTSYLDDLEQPTLKQVKQNHHGKYNKFISFINSHTVHKFQENTNYLDSDDYVERHKRSRKQIANIKRKAELK